MIKIVVSFCPISQMCWAKILALQMQENKLVWNKPEHMSCQLFFFLL